MIIWESNKTDSKAVKQINKHCDSDSDVVITISKKS